MINLALLTTCLVEMEKERGPLALAALLRPEHQASFDLILAANWLADGSLANLRIAAKYLEPAMHSSGWETVSRIVPMAGDAEPVLHFLHAYMPVEPPYPVGRFTFGERSIEMGWILRRQKNGPHYALPPSVMARLRPIPPFE